MLQSLMEEKFDALHRKLGLRGSFQYHTTQNRMRLLNLRTNLSLRQQTP